MKIPPLFMLPLIALALIGSTCEFRASTGNPHPPPDAPTEPVDAERSEGFLLVIRSGDLQTQPTQTGSGTSAATGLRASSAMQPPPPVPIPRGGAVWLLGASLAVGLRMQRRPRRTHAPENDR